MKTFRYEGVSASGAKVEGIIEAADRQDATMRARERCRVLVSVEPIGSGTAGDILSTDIGVLLSGGRINPKKLAILCAQLTIALRAGLPLVRSLKLAAENEADKYLKQIIGEVAEDVHTGYGLADSFARRGPRFPTTFIETLRAGEASGRLDECFARLKQYYEESASVKSKVGSAMIYPALLLAVSVVVMVIIMVFAVPVFEDSFTSMGSILPGPTRLLISISRFMTDNLLLLIVIAAAALIGLTLYGRTDAGRHTFARIAMTFPGICMVNRMNAAAQFSATLGTMLASGLPLIQAVRITAATAENLLIREDIMAACQGIYEGQTLTVGLRKSQWLPQLLVEMTSVGEETGQMEETLAIVSAYYTQEVDTAVKRAMDILNPAITLFLGALVVFILLAVYLPIFGMYGNL